MPILAKPWHEVPKLPGLYAMYGAAAADVGCLRRSGRQYRAAAGAAPRPAEQHRCYRHVSRRAQRRSRCLRRVVGACVFSSTRLIG